MEGPTPVSALLHAATMVTAGVFLIIRSSIVFEYSEFVLVLLIIFGVITALFAGIVAFFQFFFFFFIAYSTCSHLGYMFFSCGLSNYYVAFFHLWNHAFFKALLFLTAGALIHAFFYEQDTRKMQAFGENFPFIYIAFLIGSLAIMGFPFLTGFYSKDLILEFAFSRFIINASFIYSLGLLGAMCTAIYSIKLLFFVFLITGRCNGHYVRYLSTYGLTSECPWQMFSVMFVLTFCSMFMGYFCSDLMVGAGHYFWQDSIYILPQHFSFIEPEYIHPFIKNLPVLVSLISMCMAYGFFVYKSISIFL